MTSQSLEVHFWKGGMKGGLSWEILGRGPKVPQEDLDANSIGWGQGHVCMTHYSQNNEK